MIQKPFIPILKVSGTNYDIGFEIGQKFKDRIKRALKESVIYQYLTEQARTNPEWFDQIQGYAKKYYPQYVEEITGIADGAGLDHQKIAIINYRGSFFVESCSTVIFKRNDKIILAHNEDHEAVLGELAYLLNVELNNGTSFLAYTYPGCIPGFSFSFNSHGIVMGANAMPDPKAGMGIPRHLLDRNMLETSTLNEALETIQRTPRSGAFSFNLASMKEQRTLNVETTSNDAVITVIDDRYFHTNHYVSRKLRGIPVPRGSTLTRYNRGIEMLPHIEKSVNSALRIISDDKVYLTLEESPETEYTPYGGYYGGTLCTALFEISKDITLRLYPQEQHKREFMQFTLDDFT